MRPTAPRPGRQFRGTRWLLPLAVLLLLGVILYVYKFSIIVTVENVGDVPIEKVTIELSGKAYDLGEIEPGESEVEFLYPAGDSGVRLLWTTQGDLHKDWIGGYVTPGLSGKIEVKVDGEEVVGLAGNRAIHQQ